LQNILEIAFVGNAHHKFTENSEVAAFWEDYSQRYCETALENSASA